MDLLPGFYSNHGKVCRLRKSLYGLKQSPRAWVSRFMKAFKHHGFIQAQVDHTMFYKKQETRLAKEFDMKDLGNLRYFLGMEIARNDSAISISQQKYALDLLKETGMMGSKSVDTPMDSNVKFKIKSDEDPMDKGRYQRLVGKLIYFSHIWPNITFVVSCVSQFMHSPSESHMKAVYRILRNIGKGFPFQKEG